MNQVKKKRLFDYILCRIFVVTMLHTVETKERKNMNYSALCHDISRLMLIQLNEGRL